VVSSFGWGQGQCEDSRFSRAIRVWLFGWVEARFKGGNNHGERRVDVNVVVEPPDGAREADSRVDSLGVGNFSEDPVHIARVVWVRSSKCPQVLYGYRWSNLRPVWLIVCVVAGEREQHRTSESSNPLDQSLLCVSEVLIDPEEQNDGLMSDLPTNPANPRRNAGQRDVPGRWVHQGVVNTVSFQRKQLSRAHPNDIESKTILRGGRLTHKLWVFLLSRRARRDIDTGV
jgi:hypothetical protein